MSQQPPAQQNQPQTKAKQQFNQQNIQLALSKQSKSNPKNSKSNPKNQSDSSSEDHQQQTLHDSKNLNQQQQDDILPKINEDQNVQEGEEFMLPQERQLDKNNPKYQFCRFISRHYRLIEDKKDRKNHFVRMQPVFVRFLHVLKLRNMPLITIDTFRKYFKKFFKKRKMRYEETTNRVDMKVVVGIDRRYNSKFDF